MSKKTQALLLNFFAILCWCLSPIAIRYVKEAFPVNFQNFLRYFVSLLIIWPIFFLSNDRAQIRKAFHMLPVVLWKLLVVAGVNYVSQVCFTYSFFLVYPAFGSLLYKSGVLFSVLFSFLLFADEREIIRNRVFQGGLCFALIGVLLTVMGGKDFGQVDFNIGVIVILISTIFWSLLTVLVKKWLSVVPAAFAVSVVFTIDTPLFFLTDILYGGWHVPNAPLSMWVMLIVSGILGIGLAHPAYYSSVPVVGVALSSSIDLTRPFLVAIISFLMFGEHFGILQLWGGALLIIGSYLVIKARFQSPI